MVKEKLSGSTGKKKSGAKKKALPKKSVQTKEIKKKEVKQKVKPTKKATSTKKAAAKPKPKAKPKPAAKAKAKKVVAKKKVSVKELILRKFHTGMLDELAAKSPYKAKAPEQIPPAPPFVTGYDKKETERIRALLFEQFDLKAKPPVKETEPPEPVEEPEPIPETFERPKYEAPAWVLTAKPHPMAKAVRFGLCGLALLIVIIVGASFSNRAKFQLKNADGAIQIWRGKFAPTGTELVMRLDGMTMPTPIRDAYSEQEAYLIVSTYFQKKADDVLNEPGGPDFAKINTYLRQAASYAPTKELRDSAQRRLDRMNFLVLMHKADVAFTKGTLPELRTAMAYLGEAGSYASMDYQRELLGKRQTDVERLIAEMEAQ